MIANLRDSWLTPNTTVTLTEQSCNPQCIATCYHEKTKQISILKFYEFKNEVVIDKKNIETGNDGITVRKSLLWH